MPAKPNQLFLNRVRQALTALDAIEPVELALNQPALEVWKDFYVLWKQQQWESLTEAMLKRVPAYSLKLAMVYACFEHTVPVITKDQIEAAIQVGHYGANCADRLMQRHRQHTIQGRCEQRVLQVLEHEDLPAWKIHHRVGGRFTAEEVTRAIRALEGTGAILVVGRTARKEPIYSRRGRRREA